MKNSLKGLTIAKISYIINVYVNAVTELSAFVRTKERERWVQAPV